MQQPGERQPSLRLWLTGDATPYQIEHGRQLALGQLIYELVQFVTCRAHTLSVGARDVGSTARQSKPGFCSCRILEFLKVRKSYTGREGVRIGYGC